jgi:hypothetical protein
MPLPTKNPCETDNPKTDDLSLDEFLERITYNDQNPPGSGRPLETTISIRPFNHSKFFGIDDLFRIEKDVEVYDDAYIGKCESNAYLVIKETLLPYLQELKTKKRVDNIDVHAIHIVDRESYDNIYDHAADYYFKIGLVKLVGTIKLSNGVLDISDLTYEAIQEKKILHKTYPIDVSETNPLIKEKLEELNKQ